MNFDSQMHVELIQTNASDEMVARSAWVSNIAEESKTKDPVGIKGLINFLYKNHHDSPFEHGQYTFFISCPIFVGREFMRHRTFSFNEVSGRYSELKPHFYVPEHTRPVLQTGKIGAYQFEESPASAEFAANIMKQNSESAWNKYQLLKEAGLANEVARDVLPLNIYTSFYATVNPRNLMHFLNLRMDRQAMYEIRAVANQMEKFFKQTQPLVHAAWQNNHWTLST